MDKSNKELAIILMAAEISGKIATGKNPPTDDDLKEIYERYLSFVKKLPD